MPSVKQVVDILIGLLTFYQLHELSIPNNFHWLNFSVYKKRRSEKVQRWINHFSDAKKFTIFDESYDYISQRCKICASHNFPVIVLTSVS